MDTLRHSEAPPINHRAPNAASAPSLSPTNHLSSAAATPPKPRARAMSAAVLPLCFTRRKSVDLPLPSASSRWATHALCPLRAAACRGL